MFTLGWPMSCGRWESALDEHTRTASANSAETTVVGGWRMSPVRPRAVGVALRHDFALDIVVLQYGYRGADPASVFESSMVRRLPVIQNNAAEGPSGLGKITGAAALVVVAGFCWAVLLWAMAGMGRWAIAASCFAACTLAGAVVGSQIARNSRRQLFAVSGLSFALVVVLLGFLGGTLPSIPVVAGSLLGVTLLSGAGFFIGGWFLTLRR